MASRSRCSRSPTTSCRRTQLTDFKEAVRRFLWASYLDRLDKDRAEREFETLRELALTMPEPSATLFGYVNARDVARLGARLRPSVGEYAETTRPFARAFAATARARLPAAREGRHRHPCRGVGTPRRTPSATTTRLSACC